MRRAHPSETRSRGRALTSLVWRLRTGDMLSAQFKGNSLGLWRRNCCPALCYIRCLTVIYSFLDVTAWRAAACHGLLLRFAEWALLPQQHALAVKAGREGLAMCFHAVCVYWAPHGFSLCSLCACGLHSCGFNLRSQAL